LGELFEEWAGVAEASLGVGFDLGQGVGLLDARGAQLVLAESEPTGHGDDGYAGGCGRGGYSCGGLAVQGLLVERASPVTTSRAPSRWSVNRTRSRTRSMPDCCAALRTAAPAKPTPPAAPAPA
jgi:hypothetical protein